MMRSNPPVMTAMLAVLWLGCLSQARGQDSERVQQATRLFDAARENVKRGELEQACRQFDESERLDPQLGTKMHLADCYERRGKLASAWLQFKAAEMLAAERIARGMSEPREKIARLRAARLEKRMPTLRLVFAAALPGQVVTIDGRDVPERTWGTATPIDPGEHVLSVSAPGRSVWLRKFSIVEQKQQELRVPVLTPGPSVEAPQPSAAVPAPPALQPKAASAAATASDTERILAYSLAAAGLIVGGTGIAFGIATESTLSKRDALCPEDWCRDRNELEQVGELTREASSTAMLANVLMIGGGVALAAGVTWLVLNSGSTETRLSLQLSPALAGLTLHGRGF